MSLVNDIMLVTRVRMLHDNKAFDSLVVKYQQPIRRFFFKAATSRRRCGWCGGYEQE